MVGFVMPRRWSHYIDLVELGRQLEFGIEDKPRSENSQAPGRFSI